MNALLTEAFEKYEERVAQIAKLRDELRRAEGDRDYWREQIIERCRGASAPKAAPAKPTAPAAKPAPSLAGTTVGWTADMARRLGDALGAYGSVVGQIVGAGGSALVDRVPRANGEGVMSRISVSGTLATMRSKARARGLPDTFIGERAGQVVIDPGLVAAWRAWMEPHREERALRSAIDPEAGS